VVAFQLKGTWEKEKNFQTNFLQNLIQYSKGNNADFLVQGTIAADGLKQEGG